MKSSVFFIVLLLLLDPYPANAQTPGKAVRLLSLREAVLLAVRNNISLQTAYLDQVLDRYRLEFAQSEFDWQGNLRWVGNHNRAGGGIAPAQHGTTQNLAADVTRVLPAGGKINFAWQASQNNTLLGNERGTSEVSLQWLQPLLRGAGSSIGQANLQLAQLSQEQAKLSLRASVIATVSAAIIGYRALTTARRQTELARETLQRSKLLLQTNQALVASGRLARLELLQTESEIASNEFDLIAAQSNAEQARLALLKLIDLDLLTEIDLQESAPLDTPLPDVVLAQALAEQNRPDYLASQLALQMSQIGLRQAKDQTLWQLDLVAATTRRAQASGTTAAVQQLGNGAPIYQLGLSLTIPLADRSTKLAHSSAVVEEKKANLRHKDLQQALRVEVLNSLRNVNNTLRQTHLAEQNRQLNRQKLDAELAKLQVGRSSLFQVTSFQQSLKLAEQTYISAQTAYANALTELDVTLGTTLATWEIVLDP